MEILVCVKRVPDTAENEILLNGARVPARVSLKPLYDPERKRILV